MANVLRLADVSQGTTVDLLAGTMQLLDGTWMTSGAGEAYDYTNTPYGAIPAFKNFDNVVETMDLLGNAASATIRAGTDAIEDILEGARLYHSNDLYDTSYWLEWNANGESAKRSLIYSGKLQYPLSTGVNQFIPHSRLLARLAIVRHPLWENTTATTITRANTSCSGGTWAVAGIPGTAPARPIFQASGRTGGGTIEQFWIGIRPLYEGSGSYNPVWPAENGQPNNPDTDTAVSGSVMDIGFTTTTALTQRFYVSVEDVLGSNYNHMIGRYLVLARVKVNAADTVVGIQMRTGYATLASNQVPCAERFIDGKTKWHLIELGHFQIPGGGWYYGGASDAARKSAIFLWAELLEGTEIAGALQVDGFYLIPSEHFAYVGNAATVYSGGNTNPIKIVVQENDITLVEADFGGYPLLGLDVGVNDFYLPTGSSIITIAGQRNYDNNDPAHNTADAVDLQLSYYPRWRSYRA